MGGVNSPDLAGGLAAAVARLGELAEVCERADTGDGVMETPREQARQIGADLRVVLAAVPLTLIGGPVELIDRGGDAWVELAPDRWWCTDPDPRRRHNLPADVSVVHASRADIERLHGIAREVPAQAPATGGGH